MTIEVVETTGTVVEAYDESTLTTVEVTTLAGGTVEVSSAVLGIQGAPGLSFITVAPGDDPPLDTPDRTFVFEGPL